MKTILVDDMLLDLQLFELKCADMPDFEIVGKFTNPDQAIAYAAGHVVDFALLDIDMPGMNGMELAQRLRQIRRDIIIVFATAHPKFAVDALRMKADYMIFKPFDREDIADVMERAKLLRRRQNKRFFFRTFGAFDMLVDGEPVRFRSAKAKELIFSGGLRIYSTVDPKVQEGVEKTMYNEDDLIPALWHEEPVCLRDYPADSSSWDEVQYDEATGLPITKDGYAVYGQEAIPVYADEEGTTLKTGKSTDPDYPNDTTVYLCVYEKVRTQASIAVLDYDGNILGIGGGIGEKKVDLGFNRATSPHQTGSTMKPIGAYALALDYKLISYSSQILDAPYYSAEDKKVLKDQYIGVMSPYSEAAQSRTDVWRAWPTNYNGVGGQGNPMLIYDALQQSYNTVAVWVGDMVGVDYLYNFVHDTLECSYISAENDMDLGPLVLGSQSNGLTVVQLAGAYTMFNTGSYTTPHYYTEVTDYQGNMILDNNKYINTTQAISADTAYIMNRMLWNVLHSPKGTAYGRAPDGEMDSVAKTGTTSNYKDYTFAGLTPYYVTAIWWGCDRPTEMDKLGKAGASGKPIQLAWKYLMEDLQADLPVKEFAKGENVVEKRFDTSTGAIVSGGGAVGYYTEDNLPDSSYTVTSEEDPFAALAQAAAEAAAGAE